MARGRGGMPNMGGMNMNNLMKQAQKMQKDMEQAQTKLQETEIDVTSGGGAVKIKINGKKEVKELIIDEDVVDPDDIEMLQDLVMSAVNEAIRQVEEIAEKELGRATGGLGNLGGMGGLF